MIIAIKIPHFPHFDLEIFLQNPEFAGNFGAASDDIDNVAGRIESDGCFCFFDFGGSAHIKRIARRAQSVNKKKENCTKKIFP